MILLQNGFLQVSYTTLCIDLADRMLPDINILLILMFPTAYHELMLLIKKLKKTINAKIIFNNFSLLIILFF